jgi:hypothetical protein
VSIYSAVLSDKDRGLRLAEVKEGPVGEVDVESSGEGDADEDDGDCGFGAELVELRRRGRRWN